MFSVLVARELVQIIYISSSIISSVEFMFQNKWKKKQQQYNKNKMTRQPKYLAWLLINDVLANEMF